MLWIIAAAAAADARVELDGRAWVITTTGEVQEWQGETLVSTRAVPGAVGLFVAGGRVWVQIVEERAIPLDGQVGAAVVTPTSPTVAAPEVLSAKVLKVDRGVALIDQGRTEGLSVGDHVRFIGTGLVTVPVMEGRGEEKREVERVVATGRVRVLEEHRALVDLARGGRVSEGDRAEPRPGAYGYPVAPERFAGFREVGVAIRPLLALDTVGVAMVNEAWFTLGFEAPWYVQARIAPLALGWSRDGNPITVAALGTGGYDSRTFSVGLGAGWSMLNSDPGSYGAYAGNDVSFDADFEDVDSAFAFVQEARLGARDGLHVGVRNTLLLVPTYDYEEVFDEDSGEYVGTEVTSGGKEFVFGGIAMDVAVPTGDRTDLFVDWGTGSAGATWVEGGVSSWLRGNGDRGSLGVRVGAGYASVYGNPDDEQVQLYGPMVSVGARYRF